MRSSHCPRTMGGAEGCGTDVAVRGGALARLSFRMAEASSRMPSAKYSPPPAADAATAVSMPTTSNRTAHAAVAGAAGESSGMPPRCRGTRKVSGLSAVTQSSPVGHRRLLPTPAQEGVDMGSALGFGGSELQSATWLDAKGPFHGNGGPGRNSNGQILLFSNGADFRFSTLNGWRFAGLIRFMFPGGDLPP